MEEYLRAILIKLDNLENEVRNLKAENAYLKNIAIAGSPLFPEEARFKSAEFVQQQIALEKRQDDIASMFK